jgi:uncharacterized protein YbaR (Trm112 family)
VSQTAHEHAPDYELADEGHVNNFDHATVSRVFGPDAQLNSFRCNASLALIVGAGRYMPKGVRDKFYAFDHFLAKHVGAPDNRLKPLRNRDWLITIPGTGQGDAAPEWRCAACRGELLEEASMLRCSDCSAVYRVKAEVPDFFDAEVPSQRESAVRISEPSLRSSRSSRILSLPAG